jgi:TetR/AcrR family transcriptional repressor of nem operon
VGSLATDLKTVEPKMAKALKIFAHEILEWVTTILKEGKENKTFTYPEPPRTKALLVISNMLAAVQLCRLTSDSDFTTIQTAVLSGLLKK